MDSLAWGKGKAGDRRSTPSPSPAGPGGDGASGDGCPPGHAHLHGQPRPEVDGEDGQRLPPVVDGEDEVLALLVLVQHAQEDCVGVGESGCRRPPPVPASPLGAPFAGPRPAPCPRSRGPPGCGVGEPGTPRPCQGPRERPRWGPSRYSLLMPVLLRALPVPQSTAMV